MFKMFAKSLTVSFLISLLNFLNVDALSSCQLPNEWYGKWYQSKYTDLQVIDQTNFINRGKCIENRMDKFIFYEPEDNCYRCIFIMQKHKNVLQYRASFCTESSDFYMNCNNLTPESELMTIYRHDSVPEKCPLGGLYVMSKPPQLEIQTSDSRSYRDTFNPSAGSDCKDTSDKTDSKIMECSDDSMLKLQFGKCTNMPTFIVHCSAHWTEGSTNYLIGKVFENNTQTTTYRCFAYTEISSPDDANQNQYGSGSDFVNPSTRSDDHTDKTTLQIHVSQYEFCRNIDNVIDEQFSFTFTKVLNSKNHVAPPRTHKRSSFHKRQISHFNSNKSISLKTIHNRHSNQRFLPKFCKFPRWFNKKWHDLQQSKIYMLDVRSDSMLIVDEKSSIAINKYTCEKMQSKRADSVRAIVKSLNGCSIGYQCLSIDKKSDFVLEIKLGKINYETPDIDCHDEDYITREFAFVDTAYGVACPLKNGLYEKIDSVKVNNAQKALLLQDDSQYKFLSKRQDQDPCKQFTQTQTLQVGCQNDQQYSLRTKLCYPNQEEQTIESSTLAQRPRFTQIESEINLVCLAHWKENGNQVIVSRTMSNEILCSTWISSYDDRFLQLLAIDSNCNYKEMSEKKVDYSFILLNGCENRVQYSPSSFSSSILGADKQPGEGIAISSATNLNFFLPNLIAYLFYLIVFFKSLGILF